MASIEKERCADVPWHQTRLLPVSILAQSPSNLEGVSHEDECLHRAFGTFLVPKGCISWFQTEFSVCRCALTQ
jgi:hypothetical protein